MQISSFLPLIKFVQPSSTLAYLLFLSIKQPFTIEIELVINTYVRNRETHNRQVVRVLNILNKCLPPNFISVPVGRLLGASQ
jgi:hypothetical protein